MNARTVFRLAMLANGFQPLLNDCKRSIEKGWPTRTISQADVLAWDRSALASTGLKLDGDLAVIDVDVADAPLVDALASAFDERFPELFARGLVRHAGGSREAWIARVEEPFSRLASRRWYRGSDPDDPTVAEHQVECFGSLGTRQFAIDGPHARDRRGEVISVYQFVGSASPATVPRAALPVLPKTAFALACDRFDEIAATAGLAAVARGDQGEATPMRFELDASTEVETRDWGTMTVAELERLLRARGARANAPATMRCSGSFHDPTRVRTDSHLINWGRYGLGIYDTMTETTWHRRERAPSALFEFLVQLRERKSLPMSEQHRVREANPDTFDGEAISRADREFLASLGEHPFKRNPQYGTPCPPRPDFGPFDAKDPKQTAARLKFFEDVVTWMLANYAYREGAFVSKGGAISLIDGEIISLTDLRGRMAPWALIHVGPRGGLKVRSPVEDWMLAENRLSIRREEMRPDQLRPTFVEDGYAIFNRYRPPPHPADGGEIEAFEEFFAHLVPDAGERQWLWHWLAHKARRPWLPMIAIIMVAEDYGSGRGTLFDILELLFGKSYVVPCAFTELTGTAAAARFNARLADALIAVVNEAVDEDGHQQAQRRLAYEALKNAIEPSPSARRRFEEKYQHVTTQRSAMSAIIATQHRDVVKLPPKDRRFCVIMCGGRMAAAPTARIRAWMAAPENAGALYRTLLATPAVPLDVFNPFDTPPPFAGRLEMIGMAKSAVEDAYETAIHALEGFPLFTLSQMLKLIGYFGGACGGEGSERAKHTIAKNAYRLRGRGEPYNRIRFQKRQEILYARTEQERQNWCPADKEIIVKALKRTEQRIAHVITTGDGAEPGRRSDGGSAAAAAAAVAAAVITADDDDDR